MGVLPEQSELSRQATHLPLVSSQTPGAHWVSSVQPSQAWFWQTGVSPGQSLLATHSTQVPLGSSQTPPPHCGSPVQGTQVLVEVSQMGVLPEQSELSRQATHLPLVSSQTPDEQSASVVKSGVTLLVNVHVTACPSARVNVAVRVPVSVDPTGSPLMSSVHSSAVRENGAGSVSVTEYWAKVVRPENSRVFERGETGSSSRKKPAGSRPPVLENPKSFGSSGTTFLATASFPGETTASAEMVRSCLPVLHRPGLQPNARSAMWYGDPGIVTAEPAVPQSRRSEMCPPHAITALGPDAVNVIVNVRLLSPE